jgi:hypothetical protein
MIRATNNPNLEAALIEHSRPALDSYADDFIPILMKKGLMKFAQYESDSIQIDSELRCNTFCESTDAYFSFSLDLSDSVFPSEKFSKKGSIVYIGDVPVGFLKLKEHRNYLGLCHIFNEEGKLTQMAGGVYSLSPHVSMGIPWIEGREIWTYQNEKSFGLKLHHLVNFECTLKETYSNLRSMFDFFTGLEHSEELPKTIWWEAYCHLEERFAKESLFRGMIERNQRHIYDVELHPQANHVLPNSFIANFLSNREISFSRVQGNVYSCLL